MGTIAKEEEELMKDAKYRMYVNQIDKSLKNFEYSSEWADLIAALGKLNKVINNYAKYPVIPRRIKISKRLAQCMHPALPFGVHLKALETYDLIFKYMGTNRLSHELFIYSAGLFPLFGRAAMKVRPDLLKVYETHFVPLRARLRPALPGFLSGILPGLEEGSECYPRTNALLENVCEGVGPSHFYGCIWDCVASNACVRLPAISYILAHFDKKLPTEDQSHIMGNNIEIMVCGLIACVEDSNILVQRCALDLLILGFPMHNCHMTNDDMIRLVTAALGTILRRDLSLNRRVYGWLLGSDVNMTLLSHHSHMRKAKSEKRSTNYFEVFSKDMLVKAIKIILDNAIGKTPHDIKPYKLITSLLDRDDLGSVIIDDILFEIFRLFYLCYNMDSKPSTSELLKNANLLFGALVPSYLWEYVGQMFSMACSQIPGSSAISDSENPVRRVGSGNPNIIEVCALAEFLLDTVSLETYTETPTEHLPSLFHRLVVELTEHCDSLSAGGVARGLRLCAKILTRVQPSIVGGHSNAIVLGGDDSENSQATTADNSIAEDELPVDPATVKTDSVFEQCLRQYERFYVTFIYGTRLKVGETRSISMILESLRVKSAPCQWEEDVRQIDLVLCSDNNNDRGEEGTRNKSSGVEWVHPMKVASRLLVDLSTLQTFFQSPQSKKIFETNVSGDESNYTEFLPEWLRVLIACACWLPSGVPLQFVAISTLLDLIDLCRTAQSLVRTNSEDGLTPVLILPLLSPPHLRFIEKHTYIFQIIARWLWNQLSNPEHKLRCVELLYQLHRMLPNSDIVENCIGHSLKGIGMSPEERLEAYRRFAALWHIGREINAKQGNSLRITDIFFRSMLKMLDNLKLPESDCLKVEAQNWLFHSLIRNDLPRILDPIFYILLDPSTARLSILHIRAKTTDDITTNHPPPEEHKNVYAVSSVNGTLVYHVDPKKTTKNKKSKQVTAITSIANQNSESNPKFITKKNDTEETVLDNPKEKSSSQNMSVYVNPLSGNQPEINTDFDEYFEETNGNSLDFSVNGSEATLKSLDSSMSESKSVKNKGSGDQESVGKPSTFGINTAVKLSSLDLLNISDTLFTKVSDGESVTRIHRGSFSSEGLSVLASNDDPDMSIVTMENSGMVRSWSFPGKDLDNSSDLDESTAAEDYFNVDEKCETLAVVEDILGDLLDRVVFLSGDLEITPQPTPKELPKQKKSRKLQYQPTITSHGNSTDHIHSHILLYQKKYDSERVLYALETLRNIIINYPRPFLHYASTTVLVARSPILKSLARHRKSLFGRGYFGDLDGGNIRTNMYLEVIMRTCLYFIRSFYHLELANVTSKDIEGNRKVQICATDILKLVCSEMISFVQASGKSMSYYLADMFSRLKLYKIVLHCVLTSLQPVRSESGQLSHQVLKFNDGFDVTSQRLPMHSETLQIELMRFLLSLIILEREISFYRTEQTTVEKNTESLSDLRYINGKLIPEQPIFLVIISRALEMQPYARHTHALWTAFVASSLPCLGNALTKVVTTVLKQICCNIEELSQCYLGLNTVSFPPDYGITQVEALMVLCHFCLLDSSTKNQPIVAYTGSSSQLFNTLTHFISHSPANNNDNKDQSEPLLLARKAVLGHLPRVIASAAVLWQALINRKEVDGENCEVGSARVVKQQVLDFLSPIAVHHSTSFLAAMAVVWRERRNATTPITYTVLPTASEDQKVLVQLLIGIKAMPIDSLVQTLGQIVKQPAQDQEIAVSVEVSALELFVHYTQFVAAGSLFDSWSSFLQLLRESPNLSPPAQFLLLGALSQFVEKCPTFSDKKDLKDLQDITIKLVESCTTVAGACLEQTTWLRRNLAVREEEPVITPDKDYYDDLEATENESLITDESIMEEKPKKSRKSKQKRSRKKIRPDDKLQISAMHEWFMKAIGNDSNLSFDSAERSRNGGNSVTQYSVGALTILAQLLAPLLDVAFGNAEKERVVALLINLMYNVTPYLKNHTPRNVASYYACSQLLSSLSSYQYTRKSWKKDAMELFFDQAFFQMELRSLQYWRTIVDNLMSHEDSTFRELLNRVSVTQANALNIFSSKEQENEQRSQLLKRLAFVIYCSQNDQFSIHIKEIQERLSECIKMPQPVPGLEAQVFLCLRVLLLRMTQTHIIPLWPTIVSELVQVLIQIEDELSVEGDELRKDVDGSNGLQSAGWLQLQLAAANLLFLAVQLPADRLPQFQMYRWAFVGGDNSIAIGNNSNSSPDFIPHVTRIAQLMGRKYGRKLEALPTPLLPTCTKIKSLEDLYPFFTALSTGRYTPLSISQLEHNLELDFLDSLPTGR